MSIRHDWSRCEIQAIYDQPLLELVYQAATVHRLHHDPREVQVCRLISIKTGACPEDCAYCSQSARYHTSIKPEPLMDNRHVLEIAARAREAGATRVCMGAAWRNVKDNKQFDQVLEMVRGVNAMGMEVCCTLGMLTEEQAKRLEEAGLYAYNHNLDTSREYYHKVITTRTYDDRLNTIKNIRKTDITVCCGGILGLGESPEDRISLLHTLATMDPHPESVPINLLAQVPGTPMEQQKDVPAADLVRMVATARILMPRATVRLSAGRNRLSTSDQALCFLAGANSLFSSDEHKMLTEAAPSPDYDADRALLDELGMTMRPPFKPYEAESQRQQHAHQHHCSHCGCGEQESPHRHEAAVAEPVG